LKHIVVRKRDDRVGGYNPHRFNLPG
jgi:hypothetical protein